MKLLFSLFTALFVALFFFLVLQQPLFASPPTNFQTTLVKSTGLSGTTAFDFAPDGRIFILQRTGEVKIIKNGQLLPQNFATLQTITTGDRGLIGIAFDPDFFTNHYVYFYYTGPDLFNHLARFTASSDVGTEGPLVLYETKTPSQSIHVGGAIQFGGDKKIYLAIGDNGYSANAQDLSTPFGKILRLNKDGTIPTDNPFYGQSGALPEIWAYGLRNPYRFQFDSKTGNLYVGDVGQDTWEEVNRVVKGQDYGWPLCEGLCTNGYTFTNPFYTYNHNGKSSAITEGPIYHGSMFPLDYQNSLFFGDYAQGFIKRLTFDTNNNFANVFDFDTSAGSVVDIKTAPDGSIYYINYYPAALYRITYSTGNHIPVANASSDVTSGPDPLTVHFSSSGTTDQDNDQLVYHWDFGDNTTSTDPNPVKTYSQKGKYIVQLTVSDAQSSAPANAIQIQVGTPPTVTIDSPTDSGTYKAGDTIAYSAHAVDGTGQTMPDSAFTTEVVFHHLTHIHPFLGPLANTRSGSFATPTTGEPSPITSFEIKVTATDSNGLSTTKSVTIHPLLSTFSLQTNPSGLQVLLDGQPTTTPASVQGVIGFQRELDTPALQQLNGKIYTFDHWDDNGAQKHTFTVPNTSSSFTAFFRETTPFTGSYFNNKTLSGTPVFTRQDNIINFDWGTGSPDPSVNTDSFSARWTKTQYFSGGRYKFTTTSDDGVRLFVDNTLVIDKWVDQAQKDWSGIMDISQGDHTIKMEYYDNFGGASAKLSWDMTSDQPIVSGTPTPTPTITSTPTPTQPITNGYSAEYFDNQNLTNPVKLTRVDPAINFDWGTGSPDPSIPADHFSARWTKQQNFADGNYEFDVTADDGVRVFIDGTKILDKWIDQPATSYAINKTMTAGNHTIVMEYYDNFVNAVAKLSFKQVTLSPSPTPDPTVYQAQYFDNQTLSGSPKLTRNDNAINFDWGNGSPDPLIPNDHFSARWTKTANFSTGAYAFTVTADDGVRLFLDGTKILDKWIDQPSTAYTTTQNLTAGNHTIVMEYYENGGSALAKLQIAQATNTPTPTPTLVQTPTPTPGVTNGYLAKYWNVPGTGAAPQIPATTPDLTRTDNAINFNWGLNSPDPKINPDHFVVQWTKTQVFENATYHFSTNSDDGIRVYLDNQLVIDQWNDHSARLFAADKNMTAGNHDIKVEFYDNTQDALAQFSFGKNISFTNPFSGAYFDNQNLSGSAKLLRADNDINFHWGLNAPDPLIPVDNFSVRWTNTQNYSAGTYTFTTHSDDGVRFYIDGNTVIDDWNDHSDKIDTVTLPLSAGNHAIQLEFYDNTQDALMTLQQVQVLQ